LKPNENLLIVEGAEEEEDADGSFSADFGTESAATALSPPGVRGASDALLLDFLSGVAGAWSAADPLRPDSHDDGFGGGDDESDSGGVIGADEEEDDAAAVAFGSSDSVSDTAGGLHTRHARGL
jgi:hypothetical protein